jgi:hypothetical protein
MLVELDRLRAEGKPVRVIEIARRFYREPHSMGSHLLRDIPEDLWTQAKHKAIDDGDSVRDLILKVRLSQIDPFQILFQRRLDAFRLRRLTGTQDIAYSPSNLQFWLLEPTPRWGLTVGVDVHFGDHPSRYCAGGYPHIRVSDWMFRYGRQISSEPWSKTLDTHSRFCKG